MRRGREACLPVAVAQVPGLSYRQRAVTPRDHAEAMWERARDLVVPYDGAATEIFVLGLPTSHLRQILDAGASALGNSHLLVLAGAQPDAGQPWSQGEAEARILGTNAESLTIIRGDVFGDADVALHTWHEPTEGCEVEIVFWNDIAFPASNSAVSHLRSLARLIEIAEALRAGVAGARCALTPEHNGPTVELDDAKHVVWW